MCSYPNTSALSEQIDCAGSLTVDNVVSFSFLGFNINIEGSHILDRDGSLYLFYDSGVCDAVFGVILDDKVGDNGFFTGLPGNSLFYFLTTDSVAVPSAAFFVRGLRTVFFAGAASVASTSAFFLRPRLGFSAGASAAVAAVVSAETASTVFSTAGVTSSFSFWAC